MEQLVYERLKKTILELHAEGKQIDHLRFVKWMDEISLNDEDVREHRLMKFESRNSRFRAKLEYNKSMFEAVINTAISALKSSLLINGGASVAMLGFLAALLKDNNQMVIPLEFKESLFHFSCGVLVAGIATATTYFSQYNFQNKKNTFGGFFRYTTIALVFTSYILFYLGVEQAYLGIGE